MGPACMLLPFGGLEVPSVDEQIAACSPLTGQDRVSCWADIDRLLMETVVPYVPYLFSNFVSITSDRIVNYSYDQFSGTPAWDRFAIAPDQQ